MNVSNQIPTMINASLEARIHRVAVLIAERFHDDIYPIILKFGLLDEVHVKKYLTCETTEEIYNDALDENPDLIKYMENVALYSDEDVWAPIRSRNSPVRTPNEEGFIFASMPGSESPLFKSASKALYLEDGRILIDNKVIEDKSTIIPTEEQQELYKLVADFCQALKDKGFHKRTTQSLVFNGRNGLEPYIPGIVDRTWIRIKNKCS